MKNPRLTLLFFVMVLSITFTFGQQTNSTILPVAALDEKPMYGGSDSVLLRFIAKNMKLPKSIIPYEGSKNTVFINFIIDEKGELDSKSLKFALLISGTVTGKNKSKRMTDEKKLNAMEQDCVAESKRLVLLLKNWSVGKLGGQPVKCHKDLPFTFQNIGIINR